MVASVIGAIIIAVIAHFQAQDADSIMIALEKWLQQRLQQRLQQDPSLFGLVAIVSYGPLVACEIMTYKIMVGKKSKAAKKAVKYNQSIVAANANNRLNYQRQHSTERFNAYKKDIEEQNAQHASDIAKYKSELEAINNEIPRICKEMIQRNDTLKIIHDQIAADDTVPNKYKNSEAVEAFIDYIENRRAESLKEAINLYEKNKKEDAHNKVMEEAAQASASHARRQAQAAREMANAQNLAAFEAQRQRIAAQEAAESAKKAADANREALDILKDWERKSN